MKARPIARAVPYLSRISVALAVLSTSFVGLRAPAQTSLPAGVPAAPSGGVNPAKLPDTNGVHLGMSTDQAVAAIKGVYASSTIKLTSQKEADGTTWTSTIQADNNQNCSQGCDSVAVSLSPPPNPVQVTGIIRTINSGNSTPPTVDTVVASLRQKYGKELPLTRAGGGIMVWAYDEQGQPFSPQGPSNWSPADCANAARLEIPGATPLAQLLPKLTADLCNRGVYVKAQILPGSAVQGVAVAPQIYIILGERSLLFRNSVVAQQYAEAQTTKQQQQQMKNAQQQKAPSL